ncbi:MAG: YgiT-type zinc finger protein [Deltaproteobacteria bacterium]|nr:YgiT-type zinc finger protein [Deltaproteobacteria bacterium]
MRKAPTVSCPTCGRSGMQRVSRNVTTRVGAAQLVVRDVEVEECPHCGERLYDLAALRRIRAARRPPRRSHAA